MASCLLIDRDAGSRSAMREMLAGLGLRCTEHEDWPTAQAFPHNRFDFVFFGNADPDTCVSLLQTQHGSFRQTVFCYFTDHPSIDVISTLIVGGVSDVIMFPADKELVALKLSQAGFSSFRAAA
jgi:DNA-binding NtrC family response regulator